jgi:hypothetical protein
MQLIDAARQRLFRRPTMVGYAWERGTLSLFPTPGGPANYSNHLLDVVSEGLNQLWFTPIVLMFKG